MTATVRRASLAILAITAAALGLLAAQASAGASTLNHSPRHHVTHASSTNWAGWDNTGGTYTSVSASWVQPTVTCSRRETSYASFWVGLDGDGSNSVEQTGSEGDCRNGRAVYYSWYEFYPAYPVNFSNTVNAGDQFSASVTYKGSGSYTLVLTDSTQGWTHTTNGSAPGGLNASAEVIAEAPSSNRGVLPLANFGTMNFTNATVNGAALGTVHTAQKITMVGRNYTKAAVSNLSGNTAFSVTWQHS